MKINLTSKNEDTLSVKGDKACRNYITDMLYIRDSPDHTLFEFMHNTESLLPLIINCGNKINCMHTLKP